MVIALMVTPTATELARQVAMAAFVAASAFTSSDFGGIHGPVALNC